MKIFLPTKKKLKDIKIFFKKQKLFDLVKLSQEKKPEVNDMIKKKLYRPELKDLYFLYKIITLNKRITVLEIGCDGLQ